MRDFYCIYFTYGPHISVQPDVFIIDDFRSHELRSAQHLLHFLTWFNFHGESEVHKFDVHLVLIFEHDVLRFDVEVDDIHSMDVVDRLKDLFRIVARIYLCNEVFFDDLVKQLA